MNKKNGLTTRGKISFIPRPQDIKNGRLLKRNGGYVDKFGNIWKKGPSRTGGEAFEWDVQLSNKGKEMIGWLSRDGKHVNISLNGVVTHK
ncbi:polymorphic toxin type 17 domain-containing protein [Roseivirga sp.]|uniref:polymorphic toxin type 17 domain-containing protein n=1 Tax=Roseivirga sp. TaxID=1964215 RepID=UPI003B51F7DA